jgi:hypothetical protein
LIPKGVNRTRVFLFIYQIFCHSLQKSIPNQILQECALAHSAKPLATQNSSTPPEKSDEISVHSSTAPLTSISFQHYIPMMPHLMNMHKREEIARDIKDLNQKKEREKRQELETSNTNKQNYTTSNTNTRTHNTL